MSKMSDSDISVDEVLELLGPLSHAAGDFVLTEVMRRRNAMTCPVPEAEQQRNWHCLDCDAYWVYGTLDQPGDVPGCEHGDMERLSECCGAPVNPDIGCCPQCREYA